MARKLITSHGVTLIPKKKMLINSLTGVIQTILSTLIMFICIPVFLHRLGPELFGVFSLLQLIGNVNVFVNLGMNTSLLKFISEQGKSQESDYDIVTILLLSVVIIFPLSGLIVAFNHYVLSVLFNISAVYLNGETVFVFLALLASNVLVILGQPFTAILDAQQKIYITNLCQFIYNFLYWALILSFVFAFNSFGYVGLAILIASVVWFLLVSLFAMRSWGKLSLKGYSGNARRVLKKHLTFGLKLYASNLLNFLYEPFTKLLITHLIGIVFVGYFDIAIRIKSQIFSLIQKIFYPVFPLLSQMKIKEDINRLVQDLQQKTLIIMAPLVLVTGLIFPELIRLWLGPGKELVGQGAAIILSGTLIFSIPIIPVYLYFTSSDNVGKTILLQFFNVFSNLLFIILFYRFMGFYAVLFGNPFALAVSFLITIYYQKKIFGKIFFTTATEVKTFVLYAFLLALLAFGLSFVQGGLARCIVSPVAVLVWTVILGFRLQLVGRHDLVRYFGDKQLFRGPFFSALLSR